MPTTALELLYRFNVELNSAYDISPLESDEVFYWINKAQDRYITDKYIGITTPIKKGFEESQKRIDDLKSLVVPHSANSTSNSIPFPLNYRHLVRIVIYHTGLCINSTVPAYNIDNRVIGGKTYFPVYPMYVQQDDINLMLLDPFSQPIESEPLYIVENNNIIVYLPSGSTMVGYKLIYIKNPLLLTANDLNVKQFQHHTYTNTGELADYCYTKIIDDSIRMYLKSIGDPRYNSSVNETNLAD